MFNPCGAAAAGHSTNLASVAALVPNDPVLLSGAARVEGSVSLESDLCCMEDGWDKDSPSSAASPPRAISVTAPGLRATISARMTSLDRAQLRRPRPIASGTSGGGAHGKGGTFEERLDILLKMVQSQNKFQPPSGIAGRAMCHSVSPFVAERRRWFVAWKSQMATFLGYSRDTVAVALNYFDRYTCVKSCSPTHAQAAAATALHIAAKFEEPNPAPLRKLLQFTPVFTPEQLLAMEMSMLKVLSWDLRPVTAHDFIRGWCGLLPNDSSVSGSPATLSSKEEKENALEQLRVWAEELVDLSSYDVSFVDFLPCTMAISTLLLSFSRAASSRPSGPATSNGITHEKLLDMCCKLAAGVPSLRQILDCVRLLGSSLADRYPAITSAAKDAAARVARYGGFAIDDDDLRARGLYASGGGGISRSASPSSAAKPHVNTVVPAVKGRRCSTPTGVDGIMHIEMAAIRDGDRNAQDANGEGLSDCGGHSEPADLRVVAAAPETAATAAATEVDRPGASRARPTPCGGSFSYSMEDIVFARATKRSKRAEHIPSSPRPRQTMTDRPSLLRAVSTTAGTDPPKRQPQQGKARPSASLWNPFSAPFSGPGARVGGVDGREGVAMSVSSLRRCRKRSAEALGHCETGSGFGAPTPRGFLKAAAAHRPPPQDSANTPS